MIRKTFILIGQLCSYLLPCKLTCKIKAMKTYIYTGYHKRHFHCWGENAILTYKAAELMGEDCISVGENTVFEERAIITARKEYQKKQYTPQIIIGDNCHFGRNIHISSIRSIVIGNNLLTGSNVLITDNAHGMNNIEQLNINPHSRDLSSKGGIMVGNNVWIGNNVCILSGVTIGNCAIIGANSVVTHDIPSYCVAAGTPAKTISLIKHNTRTSI